VRHYKLWWPVGSEGIAGVVKEDEAGGWVMGIFYWEAWVGVDGLPGQGWSGGHDEIVGMKFCREGGPWRSFLGDRTPAEGNKKRQNR
jgi:hypothetical protein